ncbi:response regulator [Pedobacter puniceum]|jgi:CheY-like chemotaxis protein|uniref:Response regulator n=1 Tax=Pedobacter puniceum TaxID=2666136 RepID=A0A7K0FRC6_9SPHI|nr:response regulator [Pedobacter puniceum]MRX48181.1 response regulator [Pedobacter puniceum]
MSKILLVEDETILRETLAEILELNDFEVIAASSGFEALEVLKDTIPDLILSDVLMPGMTGFEMIEQVKIQEHLAHIPFIFLSALTSNDDKQKALSLGCKHFITKPFKSFEVVKLITATLDC